MNRRWNPYLFVFVLLFFLYLAVNVLINFTPLRQQIVNDLEERTFDRVEISFIYLSWQARPTVRSMILVKSGGATGGTTRLELEHVELQPAWTELMEGNLWNLRKNLRMISVDRSRIIRTVRGESDPVRGIGKTAKDSSLEEFFPALPLSINQWTLRLRRNQREFFRLAGREAKYQIAEDPFVTRVTSIQDNPSDVTLTVQEFTPLTVQSTINELSLPDSLWELEGDRWEGTVSLESGAGRRLSVSLTGVPGVIREKPLPPIDVTSELYLEEGSIRLEEFSARSDYLNLEADGRMNPSQDSIELDGEYSVRVKDRLNPILPDRGTRRFRVTRSDSLTGDVRVVGPLSDYKIQGAFSLPSLDMQLISNDYQRSLSLKALAGTIDGEGVNITEGILESDNQKLVLGSGEVYLADGEVRSSIQGNLTQLDLFAEVSPKFPEKIFGPVQSTNIPLEFSSRFTPSYLTGDLVVKDGRINFQHGSINGIKMLLSHSSQPGAKNIIRGRLKDPGGNSWSFNGDPSGSVSVRSKLESLDFIFDKSQLFDHSLLSKYRPEKVNLSGVIKNTGTWPPDYDIELSLADSRLLLGEEDVPSWPMTGAVVLMNQQVAVRSVTINDPGNSNASARIHGNVNHSPDWSQGTWDLRIKTNDFNVDPFLDLGLGTETRLNLNLNASSDLTNPVFTGSLNSSRLDFLSLQVGRLSGDLSFRDGLLSATNLRGELSDGRLSGSVDYRLGEMTDLQFKLKEFQLPGMFPEGTWMYKKSHGRMSLKVDLRGVPGRIKSFRGSISGRGQDVVLDNFPEIEDIKEVARPSVFEKELQVEPFEFDFPVDSGVIQVPGFRLDSDEITLKTSGGVQMSGELALDLTLVLRGDTLKRYLQDVLGNLYRRVGLRSGEKKLTIPFKIKGTIEKPVLDIQRDKVSSNFRKNLMRDLFTEPIGKPLNELIGEIFLLD